ncbi:MAG: hypothetical protein RIC85_03045 [Gammaproteobacteria bacterium]
MLDFWDIALGLIVFLLAVPSLLVFIILPGVLGYHAGEWVSENLL